MKTVPDSTWVSKMISFFFAKAGTIDMTFWFVNRRRRFFIESARCPTFCLATLFTRLKRFDGKAGMTCKLLAAGWYLAYWETWLA